ncbi:Rho GTPase activation protein [Phakopsora pachyrhizi]|nr:Rho GTPase activation protein [Phakopsora pachyrhizi]
MPYSSATIEISGKQHFICLLVYATIEEIYSRGMASPGLLRNMGTEENIERLVNLFESLPPKSLAPDLSKENIHDLCGLLTRFIRGVPSPLMEPTFASLLWARCVEPDNLFSEKFIKTNETQEMKTRSQSYHKLDAAISLFKLIPDTEFTLLVFILTFLYKTTMFPHNGATARYIATQFGPHIIGPKDFQSTFSKRQVRYSMESINGSNRGAETLSWLLNNWNEIGRGLGHQRAVLLNISNALRERVDVDSKIKEEEKEELEKTSDRSSEDQSLIDVKYTPSISLQPIRVIPLKKEDHSTNPNTFSSPENSSEFETAQLYSGTDSQPSSKAVLLNFSSPNSGGNPVSEKFQAVLIKSFNGHTTTESNSLKTSSELDDIKPTTEAELKSASSASKNIFSQPKSFGFPSSENLRSNVPRTPRDFLARRKNRESLSSDSEHGMSDLDDLNKSEEGNSSNSSIEDLETIYKRSPKQKNSKKNNQYYSPSESHKSVIVVENESKKKQLKSFRKKSASVSVVTETNKKVNIGSFSTDSKMISSASSSSNFDNPYLRMISPLSADVSVKQDDPLSVVTSVMKSRETVIKAQAWAIEDAERYVKLAVERLESSERELRSTRENLASFLKQLNDLSTVPGQIL